MANKNKLRHKNSKSILKTGLILISVIGVITFLIISYLIYSLQCYAYDNNISSDNLNLSVLIKSMPYWTNPTFTAPFDIGAIMQMHGSVWYIYVVALSLLALMLFSKNYDDYKGVEAGSADWATKRDEKDNSDETGIPIGNKFYVTVNNPHGRYYEPHNLNEILIGGPGAGKTFRKIKPDIIQMYGSYVVTDPKGELYRDTAKLLMDNGYKVRVFNLINIKKTNAYNPFVYINDEQDIVVLANTFINASAGDDDKEDFWSGSAKSLLTAIMIYLWKAEGEVKCFGRVVRLLNSITYKNGRIDELCELARCLNKHSIEPMQFELVNYKGVIKILVGLLLAKLWVDLSTDICIALIDTCTDIASSVFTSADEMIVFPSFDTLKSTDTGLWIIGELLNQLLDIVLLAPIIIVALAILIICGLIMIKLMLRTFELALYCSVSPAFFACLLGDATKGYFKRFIDGLLSSALSLVYMGLIYLAGSYWCKVLTMNNVGVDSPMDVLVWLSSAGPKVLVVLAMGFLILKPPLALRQLTGGS